MRSTFGFRAGLVGGVSLLGLLAMPAMAQTISEDVADDTTGISEIVVTAQRTAQSLQDVPISVSAFTSESLKERQIFNTTNLIQSVPNVAFTKGNFTGSNLTIRGVGNTAVSSSADAGVGIHYNDMPVVNPRLFESELYDMERVEILRGPQGTLFGRNATAGVINFITAKASTKGIGAFGEVAYGNYNSIRLQGMVNVPIGDTFAVRVAGYYLNRDGFTENLWDDTRIDGRNSYGVRGSVTWEPTDSFTVNAMVGYFNEDSDRSRIQKQLCISDPTGILGCAPNGLDNQHTNGNSTLSAILTSQEFLRLNGFGALAPGLAYGSIYNAADNTFANSIVPEDVRQVATRYTPTYQANELVAMANIEYRWDNFSVTAVGGYVQSSVDSRVDYSLAVNDVQRTIATNAATLGTFLGPAGKAKADLLFPGGNQICLSQASDTYVGIIGNQVNNCSNRQGQYDISTDTNHQWSGELRLESSFDGPINFLVGGIYLNYVSAPNQYVVVASGLDYASLLLTSSNPVGLASPFFDNRVEEYNLSSYAFFGEVYWDITSELKLTLGGRYTSDSKSVQDVFPQILLSSPVPLGTQDAFDKLRYREVTNNATAGTGRVLLQWTPTTSFSDSSMFYASWTRGYKAGGINPAFIEGAISGATTTFAPEYINAFEIGTKNQFLDGTLQANLSMFYYDYSGLQVSRILARSSFNDNIDATVFGIEGEFIIQPIPALQFNVNFSYLKTSIGDAAISDSRDPSAGRSDAVIIKDITNAANCVVLPTGNATGAQANQLVSILSGAAGLKAPTPVPGTQATGAYGVCSAIKGTPLSAVALANNIDNPTPGLRALFNTPTGPLPFQYITNPNGSVNMPDGVPVNLEGNQLQNSPEFKFAIGGQYNFDIGQKMSGFARIDYNFTGNFYARIYNAIADRVEAFGQMDAQIQINGPDNRWYTRLFVQNVTDNNAITGQYVTDASSGLFTNIFTLDPRTYGIAVGFNY